MNKPSLPKVRCVAQTLAAFAGLATLGIVTARAERVTDKDIYPERELLITAPEVVDSAAAQYPGPWSFGGLIEQLVGPENAGDCVRKWLETWNEPQKINDQDVAPRFGIFDKVILPWQTRDGYHPEPGKYWVPQLQHAPFRLLAIVNRMDLCAPEVANTLQRTEDAWRLAGREKLFLTLMGEESTPGRNLSALGGFYGSFGSPPAKRSDASAGEGRFVFCAVDENGAPLGGDWTVILEYNLKSSVDHPQIRNWAEAWHGLGVFDVKGATYRSALENLTRTFTHSNSPSLAQLRSNEAAFGPGREFRQFGLAGGTLGQTSLTQTPGPAFGQKRSTEQQLLGQFLHDRAALIRDGINRVPDTLEGTPLLAGSAIIPPGDSKSHWDFDRQVTRETRRLFSLDTCNGCHGGETACAQGLHIRPRAAGAEAVLSDFLRRDGHPFRVDDPETRGVRVEYHEIGDRAAVLAALMEPNDTSTIDALRPILRSRLNRAH